VVTAGRRQSASGGRRIVFLGRLLARFDLCGVMRDRADGAPTECALDRRRMHFIWWIAFREFTKSAGKRGLRRNLCASLPTTDVAW
jgi:hypothetical protein